MSQVKGFFPRLGLKKAPPSSNSSSIDEAVIGKTLSPELFRQELSDLGYDFEVFADKEGKIWRFRRITPKDGRNDGDVW